MENKGIDYLKLFASLEHINSKYEKVEDDWGYAPTLYSFDGQWHVSWVSCEELDVLISYEADSPQEAILKAFVAVKSFFNKSLYKTEINNI